MAFEVNWDKNYVGLAKTQQIFWKLIFKILPVWYSTEDIDVGYIWNCFQFVYLPVVQADCCYMSMCLCCSWRNPHFVFEHSAISARKVSVVSCSWQHGSDLVVFHLHFVLTCAEMSHRKRLIWCLHWYLCSHLDLYVMKKKYENRTLMKHAMHLP